MKFFRVLLISLPLHCLNFKSPNKLVGNFFKYFSGISNIDPETFIFILFIKCLGVLSSLFISDNWSGSGYWSIPWFSVLCRVLFPDFWLPCDRRGLVGRALSGGSKLRMGTGNRNMLIFFEKTCQSWYFLSFMYVFK